MSPWVSSDDEAGMAAATVEVPRRVELKVLLRDSPTCRGCRHTLDRSSPLSDDQGAVVLVTAGAEPSVDTCALLCDWCGTKPKVRALVARQLRLIARRAERVKQDRPLGSEAGQGDRHPGCDEQPGHGEGPVGEPVLEGMNPGGGDVEPGEGPVGDLPQGCCHVTVNIFQQLDGQVASGQVERAVVDLHTHGVTLPQPPDLAGVSADAIARASGVPAWWEAAAHAGAAPSGRLVFAGDPERGVLAVASAAPFGRVYVETIESGLDLGPLRQRLYELAGEDVLSIGVLTTQYGLANAWFLEQGRAGRIVHRGGKLVSIRALAVAAHAFDTLVRGWRS